MTRDEAKELYGKVPCVFSGYYKYTFTFRGIADDGATITLSVGGNADDIYRYSVSPNTREFLEEAYAATIEKDGETVFDFYDP